MRALFLVLLLANLLFLAWSRWVAPPPDVGGRATPASPAQPAIHLLREAKPGVAAPVAGPPATCVSGGPYLDRPSAEQAAANLAGLGYTSRLRAARDQVWVGQWVRIDNLATPEDAQNVLSALKAAGVGDAFVLTDETPGNVVSLGIFSDPTRAEEAMAAARAAGFAPRVDDHYRVEDVYWLDVDRDANAGLPGLEPFEVAGGQAPRIELRACPPVDSVTPAPAAN
jgi:hypothetical protein